LKIIGLCMLNAKTYLVGCSFNEPKFELAVQYYEPSAVFGSRTINQLRISDKERINELFLILGYEPLPIQSQSKQAKFKLSAFFTRVNTKIGDIVGNVGFYKVVNKTTQEPRTTIVARYNYDHGLFLNYLDKTKKNIDALNNSNAVAHWIKDFIWSSYTTEEQKKIGTTKTTKKGAVFGLGGTVVETYEQSSDWARDVVSRYEHLAPVFKCVFEAQVIELTASPPQPVAAPAPSAKQPVAAPAPSAKQPVAAPAPSAKQTQPIAPGTVIRGNLVNTISTMCYLDAAMQMLLAIPEIPDFFAKTNFKEITQLKPITDEAELLLNACDKSDKSDKSKEIQNIKLWKIIFDEIRTKQPVSIKDISISTQNGTINPYARLVSGCKTNAFLRADKKDYTQADPSELMTLLFFPNFSCLIIPSINETVGITKEDTTSTKTHVLSVMLSPDRYKYETSIARLLESSAFGTLISLQDRGNYLIMAINRAYIGDDGRTKKNQTRVEITREIDILGVKFTIKGCIFHSGDGQGGHYVYGVYDDTGNPHHVIDDLQIAERAQDVFNQNGWMSTMFLYKRVQ